MKKITMEEPDYMSDEFLQGCIGSASDERPGLIKSRKEQREHDIMKTKSMHQNGKDKSENKEVTALEEGLKKPIASENKGFLMIQKMGFKPGMGLGKNSSGIIDPVPVSQKNDRMGLGALSRQQIQKKRRDMALERLEKLTNIDDYVASISKKHKEREIASDLRKSQRICHQLDLQSEIERPEEVWFWPEDCLKSDDEKSEEVDDDLELSEKLELLTSYLRKTYFYCIWCGTQYGDEKDLQDCPGPLRELH